ncbi:MAG: hypothetical protein ACRD9Y_23650 [Blastocatellia bacterium]
MTTHPDDLALVERIVGGDEEAAEAFGRQYQKRFAYLARRGACPGRIARMWRRRSGWRRSARFGACRF